MPTVLRIGPYRFHFYSRENDEPPHIHVTRDDIEAKFWLQPISVAANHGFGPAELNQVRAATGPKTSGRTFHLMTTALSVPH